MAQGYITKLNENVVREHVRYNNRYGIAIAADIYRAKDLDETKKYPALIVGAPYGGVKEQGPCVYTEKEIAETLLAAGCRETEIEMIVSCIRKGDLKNTEKLIAACRKKQLERMHDSQACIDRLDYLSCQLQKA